MVDPIDQGAGKNEKRTGSYTLSVPSRGRYCLLAGLAAVGVTLVVWAPFLGRPDLFLRHFDGPIYMIVAKALYAPPAVNPLPGYVLRAEFFAIVPPLFPMAVRLLSFPLGIPAGLFLASILFVAASAAALVLYARRVIPEVALSVAVAVFCLVPARHVLYRALGSAEGAMALFVLLAAWAWHEERIGAAYLFASLATVTRVNGVLVIGVLSLLLLARRRIVPALAGGLLALVPLGLVFAWQAHVLGTPLAFFNVHGSKRILVPFAEIGEQLRIGQWEAAELLLATYLFMALAAGRLWVMKLPFESLLVMAHIGLFSLMRESDLPRWSLTVAPFVYLVAWRDLWKETRVAALALVGVGTLSVAYAWQSSGQNLLSEPVYDHLLAFLH